MSFDKRSRDMVHLEKIVHMNRILPVFVMVFFLSLLLPTHVFAAEKSGKCGDNVTWTLSESGILTLSGEGATWDYSYVDYADDPIFKDMNITSVVVNEGITELGSSLFDSCVKLKTVRLPSGIKAIGWACFAQCSSLTKINIPDGVESIGWFAFQKCKSLTEMTLPESITVLGSSVFAQCENLTSLNIPNKVTRIESNLIDDCSKLTHINIPKGVTFIDFSAFANSGITSIKLPEGITSIEECTFWGCSDLKTVEIPENVKSIGESAFWGTIELTVIMHKNIESIADDAFEGTYEPTICGQAGSTAQKYAKKHGIKFVVLCDKYKWGSGSSVNITEDGHRFGKWSITKAASEIAPGKKSRTCAACGKKETKAIKQLKPTLPAVKIIKPKAEKKSATINWKAISKKNLKKIKKIEIQYSDDKSFTIDIKKKYVSAKKTSQTITKLKSNKKYYVRIRAYTKTNGKVHVSKWSTIMSLKTK